MDVMRVHEGRKEVMSTSVTQTCMRIVELEERCDELGKLVRDIHDKAAFWIDHYSDRARELGIEVR